MCPLKVLNVAQIREADRYTIENEPVDSIDLMERAAGKCYEWFAAHADRWKKINIIAGMGNNGGDGLALARMLSEGGFTQVEVNVVRHTANGSADFNTNFERLADIPEVVINDIFEQDPTLEIAADELVVDALLGSGLNKPVTGFIAQIIRYINQSRALVVAIDVPSGLFADSVTEQGTIVRADYTLTFQQPKLSMLLPQNYRFTGEVEVLNIGLLPEFIDDQYTQNFLTTDEDIKGMYVPRNKTDHKGVFGHALIIAGSTGKIGAAVLAAQGALRAGAGLVTMHLPVDGYLIMQSSVPEAMVSLDRNDASITSVPALDKYSAIAIGPGIGTGEFPHQALRQLIQQSTTPLVLDADALNILGTDKNLVEALPPDSILTPHPGEFNRLVNETRNEFDRLELLRLFAKRHRIFVVLKGAHTAIATPEGNVYFNPTGNPGMATGGSGDVLTGIITGLLASGYSSFEACILGVWLHGKAGDLAAETQSEESMIAGDIARFLGQAFRYITS